MEPWRQCAQWLINCRVLPPNHRVTWESAQVFDLAQTLRDGVLLCQLLNNLRPQSINLKEINLRPQMSQVLVTGSISVKCLSLQHAKFSKKEQAPFSLQDRVRDCHGVKRSVQDDENGVEDEEDLYDCVYGEDEGGEVYEDLMKTEATPPPECSKRANNGKFTLRDLLVVPMQRVLKYHLLLQELVKHTHDPADKSKLRMALDAMKDLAQYVNEVKRDNETLREIDQFQLSIENLNQSLRNYGRPKVDGEVRVSSLDRRSKQDRHIFLFDKAVIVCKRRGDNYEMKEVIDLHKFKITDNPTTEKESKKWSYGFYLTHIQGQNGFEFFFKTKELKKKWLEQFGMAVSNIRPENANWNCHEFKMHTFERITSCSSCNMLLRGIFNQGYICVNCGAGAHKECLGRLETCGKVNTGLPKMQVIRNYHGVPAPTEGPALHIQIGDIIEVMHADVHSSWWEVPKPVDYSAQPWFAGAMERLQAETELINRVNSTYLVRHRSKEGTEYAISIKYNNDVKHIKILAKDGVFYIAENKKFKNILELIEYYKHHSLKEGFRSLDTTLLFPFKEPENSAAHRRIRSAGNTPLFCGFSFVAPPGYSFVPPSSAPFWSVLTPKVVGIAIARYDFCPRDMRELALSEGDVVKIYTKTGANGWWRGEANGRLIVEKKSDKPDSQSLSQQAAYPLLASPQLSHCWAGQSDERTLQSDDSSAPLSEITFP
ncbi:VAV3 factor, partial [Polypterus senegalus]